jgi:hypothetical protein
VLGPEHREDGELEIVRLARQQLPDAAELPVGETEGTVERLCCDGRQAPILASPCGRSRAHAAVGFGHAALFAGDVRITDPARIELIEAS